VAHVNEDLDQDLSNVRGTPWTMTDLGDYQSFVLDHGTYWITAWMDVNGNLLLDDEEPVGKAGPIDVQVTPGVTYIANILLKDPTGRPTAIAPVTWTAVKGLYQH
jgi:hypothetical protein